ncbi:MAG: hypothetical protein OER56_02635 [Hyphomicrobiales bacterium]|nr:hypothetical protein [Hyphomicrobiales bacterium]
MGFRICYIVSKLHPDELATELNLQITGTEDEMPVDDWWTAALKSSGWSVLWSQDEEFAVRSRDLLAELSHKADLVHCEINETVMWSSAEWWSKGKSVWSITHAGDGEDRFDLRTEGELPTGFRDIKERRFLSQQVDGEVDHVFDIPVELVRFITGFRYDDYLEREFVDEFRVLQAPPKTGILSRIFRRAG